MLVSVPDKPRLPSPERVRILTASKDLKPEDADKHGDQFFEAGNPAQAMMFYERSKNPDRLRKVKEYAVGQGDAFLLLWVAKLSPELLTPEDWTKAGENAMANGRVIFAKDCFEKAELPDRAREARQEYLKIFQGPGKS